MVLKIYIIDGGERYYLSKWYVYDEIDCVVFTAIAKHAMKFRDRDVVNDYHYQLRAMGYQPRTEVC